MTDLKQIDWTLFSNREIEDIVDKGLRHRSGVKPQDYLKHWLFIGRQFAFATHDDSWGEFEKEFAIIVKRMIRAERKLKELGVEVEQ